MVAASDPDLVRLLDAAHHATKGMDSSVQAIELYRAAALVAERLVPAPIGVAVAGVLAIAAEHRRASGMRGNLGADKTMLALACAVLALEGS